MIEVTSARYPNFTIQELCDWVNVSRSGFYNWKKHTRVNQARRAEQDQEDFRLIKQAFDYRGFPKGKRAIRMHLLHHEGIRMNLKKIQRLMTKFQLHCPIRRANPYRQMAQANHEHRTHPNYVQRRFKAKGPRQILLTDITYCFYGNCRLAYLTTVKDAYTNEILAYDTSESLKLTFVMDCFQDLFNQHGHTLTDTTVIHSDQGAHYTSISFRELLEREDLIQSMSRRGNCWDNAPQESFFGHLKDNLNLKGCETYQKFQEMIDDFMHYYNKERYQEGLLMLSPSQFYTYSLTGVDPLEEFRGERHLPAVRTIELVNIF